MDRAERPYPPTNVTLDGVAFNPTITNLDPVAVAWDRRDRLSTAVKTPSDPDETPESGTEYFVQYGVPGSMTEASVGTGTSGTFNFDLKGSNVFQMYAKNVDGLASNVLQFNTTTLNGMGASIFGALPTAIVVTPPAATVSVGAVGALPTVVVTYSEPGHAVGEIGTVVVTGIEGVASVQVVNTDLFQVSLIAPSATVDIEASGDATGDIGTVDLTAIDGSAAEAVEGDASGDIGTIDLTAPEGSAEEVAAATRRYWGVRFLSNMAASDGGGLSEVEMYESLGGENVVSQMTAVTDGTVDLGKSATQATDGKVGIAWVGGTTNGQDFSVSSAHPFIWYVDFGSGSEKLIKAVRLFGYELAFESADPKAFEIIASDDAVTWDTIWGVEQLADWGDVGSNYSIHPDYVTDTITPTAFTQWRTYFITPVDEAPTFNAVFSAPAIQFRDAPGGTDLTQTLGGTYQESDHYVDGVGDYSGGKAFDNDVTTLWVSPIGFQHQNIRGHYLGWTFGSAQVVGEIAIQCRQSDNTQAPKIVWAQASNDGTHWTTVGRADLGSGWTSEEIRTVAIDNGVQTGFPPVTTDYANAGGSGDRSDTLLISGTLAWSGLSSVSVDGAQTDSVFLSPGGQTGKTLVFDFFHPRVVQECTWYQNDSETHGSWTWQGSEDGETWDDIGVSFTLGGTAQVQTELNTNVKPYRVYQLRQDSGSTSNGPYIREIEFKIDDDTIGSGYYASLGSGDRSLTVGLSGALSGLPTNMGVINGSLYADNQWFNDNVTSGFVKFDFGTAVTMKEAALIQNQPFAQGTWQWAGSNDDTTYTDVGDPQAIEAVISTTVFSVLNENMTAYRYWKMYIVSGRTFQDPYFREIVFSLV